MRRDAVRPRRFGQCCAGPRPRLALDLADSCRTTSDSGRIELRIELGHQVDAGLGQPQLHQATVGGRNLADEPAAAFQRSSPRLSASPWRWPRSRRRAGSPSHPRSTTHIDNEAAPCQVVLPQHRVSDVRPDGVGGAVGGSRPCCAAAGRSPALRGGGSSPTRSRRSVRGSGMERIVIARSFGTESRVRLGDKARPTAIDSSEPLDTIVWIRTIPLYSSARRGRNPTSEVPMVCQQRRSSGRHRGRRRRHTWGAAHSVSRTSCSSWSPRPHRSTVVAGGVPTQLCGH